MNTKHEIRNMKHETGFTILELLVTMGIVGLLVVIALPTYNEMKQNVAVDKYSAEAMNALRKTQYRAIVSKSNIRHGVHFTDYGLVVFGGDSWASRVYEETFNFGSGVETTQGSGSDIIFDRLTGETSEVEINIGFTTGKEKTISVSALGQISLN